MSRRVATWVAWSWFGLVVALTVGMGAFILQSLPFSPEVLVQSGLVYLGVGALIASRRPSNPIGWLLMVPGTFVSLPLFALLDVLNSDPARFGALIDWVSLLAAVAFVPMVVPVMFLLLLFPTGRAPGPRWRPVLVFGVVLSALIVSIVLLAPNMGVADAAANASNPLTPLRGAAAATFQSLVDRVGGVLVVLIAVFGFVAAAAPLIRYRSAGTAEREQIRWLLFAGALFAVGLVFGLFIDFGSPAVAVLWSLAQLAVPVAVAVAILRHRLFDIDVIIRRTLQYGVLTAILGGLYFGSVLLVQALLEPLVGGADSPPVVVVTTLILAALFNPLRRRVQRFIDRRFYRRKVDAERAVARFATFARDEVDLSELRRALFGAVVEALEPERMGLWLREPGPETEAGMGTGAATGAGDA